jgi:hypothetical protein
LKRKKNLTLLGQHWEKVSKSKLLRRMKLKPTKMHQTEKIKKIKVAIRKERIMKYSRKLILK